jgi:membrane complex biogenesis BtpA family protein
VTIPRGLIGVIHMPALPGDPGYRRGGFASVLSAARNDARALAEAGFDAIIVENFGSSPFPKGTPDQPTPPHQIAAMALAVAATQVESSLPVGVNVLRNDVRSALGIAAACGAAFVRVNVHVGAYVTDQGLIEGRAFETLRYRRSIEADAIAILADVRVKHATPLAAVPIESEIDDCLQRGHADAIVITGTSTGKPVSSAFLAEARRAAGDRVVLIGSGFSPSSADLARLADGAIVGTWIKKQGNVRAPIDVARAKELVESTRAHFHRAHG